LPPVTMGGMERSAILSKGPELSCGRRGATLASAPPENSTAPSRNAIDTMPSHRNKSPRLLSCVSIFPSPSEDYESCVLWGRFCKAYHRPLQSLELGPM